MKIIKDGLWGISPDRGFTMTEEAHKQYHETISNVDKLAELTPEFGWNLITDSLFASTTKRYFIAGSLLTIATGGVIYAVTKIMKKKKSAK